MPGRFLSPYQVLRRELGKLSPLKYLLGVAAWPIVAAILITGIWVSTLSTLETERESTKEAAFKQATSIANSYAQQLHQTVELIDQITLNLKYDWEEPNSTLNLEKKRGYGVYPESSLLYALIIDANSDVVTSSISSTIRPNVADRPYFQRHKAGCCIDVLISGPEIDRVLGRPIIRFSRRLEKPDGSFDGVAVASVQLSYLTSFQNDGISADDDFISVRYVTGPLLAAKLGNGPAGVRTFYRSDPLFATSSGVAIEPAEKFVDNEARFVAWKQLDGYPLVALAGLCEPDIFEAYDEMAHERKEMTALTSIIVGIFSLVGMWISARLAARRRQEEEVRETYRLATDAANEGFYMIRPVYDRRGRVEDFRIEDCNHRGAELFGLARKDVIGWKTSELEPKEYRSEVFDLCLHALETGFFEDEKRVSPPSCVKAKWVHRRMVRSGAGLALAMRDISEAKAHEEALFSLANNDALTQLPNRHWLANFLPSAVARAKTRNGHLSVLFIDLDDFKNINDTLGHDAGDELLQQATQRLRKAVRASDHVVRLGGDEFTVILEYVDVMEDVSRAATSIIKTIGEPFTLLGSAGNHVNASIGISMFPQDGLDGETLLKHADIAMYAAKAAGKGRFQYYQAHLSDTLILRLSKESALRHAVEHNEFVVHYQPRVKTYSGKLCSMEALVRWNRPERGLVYPTEFIDLAEDNGLIVRVGELVIENVCAQLANWRENGVGLVPVSINISPLQLKIGKVSSFLAACLKRHGIEPNLIEVELTESAVIDRSLQVTNDLAELRALGVKLMIDDFGTGYSSLAQLRRLDVDMLKVDQAFTQALVKDDESEVIFRAIVSMADALDISVVAEGVETVEQLEILRSLSCNEIQGYFVSKAVAANEMSRLMLRQFLFADSGPASRLAPI